jgi:hypothetical protein
MFEPVICLGASFTTIFRCFHFLRVKNKLILKYHGSNCLKYKQLCNFHNSGLDIIHRSLFCLKHNVSVTGFCLRLQVETTKFGRVDTSSFCSGPIWSFHLYFCACRNHEQEEHMTGRTQVWREKQQNHDVTFRKSQITHIKLQNTNSIIREQYTRHTEK